MIWYVMASLLPAVLLGLACLWGGGWSVLALAHVTVFVYALDRLTRVALAARDDADRAATGLSVLLALVHFALLAGGVAALSSGPPDASDVALFIALGLYFGQAGNANAHELIHKTGRLPRMLGVAVYVSLLFGHHASAHPQVHHVWVASPKDPNSARPGEGFYRFWLRAWTGSFRAGWDADARRLKARGLGWAAHPYLGYAFGALLILALAHRIGGGRGVLVLLGLAVYAQMQLLLSDYVQHYGLRRLTRPDGRLEPVGPQHSWNAAPWFSSAMMLNAPRHSDHHLHPGRAFPALTLEPSLPMLPFSFPMMGLIATLPPLWRRLMDPRVAALTGGAATDDLQHSGP